MRGDWINDVSRLNLTFLLCHQVATITSASHSWHVRKLRNKHVLVYTNAQHGNRPVLKEYNLQLQQNWRDKQDVCKQLVCWSALEQDPESPSASKLSLFLLIVGAYMFESLFCIYFLLFIMCSQNRHPFSEPNLFRTTVSTEHLSRVYDGGVDRGQVASLSPT